MMVKDDAEPCGPDDARLADAMRGIGAAGIPYNPFSTNSNAVAREGLERSGLPAGSPPVWAPGWGTRLPR